MKPEEQSPDRQPLDRLLRAAAAHRAAAAVPDDSVVPWTLEQRVLASLRQMAPSAEPGWLLPVIRRAFATAALVFVASAGLHLSGPATDQAEADLDDSIELMAFADIPVTELYDSAP